MNTVHIFVQSKGGVGKTVAATSLTEYLAEKKDNILAIDLDQSTPTFSHFGALHVQHFDLKDENGVVDPTRFTPIANLALEHDGDVVIDIGASTYTNFVSYLLETSLLDVFRDAGRNVLIHIPVAGGDNLQDTANSFADLADLDQMGQQIVVWRNGHFGKVEYKGVPLDAMPAYKANAHKIVGIIELKRLPPATLGIFTDMKMKGLTFAEAQASEDIDVMSKSGLRNARKAIFGQIEALGL